MKKYIFAFASVLVMALCSGYAFAGYDWLTTRVEDLTAETASSVDSTQKLMVLDFTNDDQDIITATDVFGLGSDATDQGGRGHFVICGEATTINNNTVYYGPDIDLTADSSTGLDCDIDATGNATEATADAPAYTNKAVHVTGMTCRNEGDANANISFTLRTAAGATVPSVTCTIADGERDCVADIQTTTAIAAGATVAVAGASSSNVGDNNGFVCTVDVSF
jgi:hypothetical protein